MVNKVSLHKLFLYSLIGTLATSFISCSGSNFRSKNVVSLPNSEKTLKNSKSSSEDSTAGQPKKHDGVDDPQSASNNSDNPRDVPEGRSLNIVGNGSFARQRKNYTQLEQSYAICLSNPDAPSNSTGLSLLNLNPNMILNTVQNADQSVSTAPNADQSPRDGRIRFLDGTYLNAANATTPTSILTLEREYLETSKSRTSTSSDTLEDEVYLNSLLTIANVAAFNCDVDNETSPCYCSTTSAASKLLQRCLPLFSPDSEAFKAALASMTSAENCGSREPINRRKAIASLLSSYAFATAK